MHSYGHPMLSVLVLALLATVPLGPSPTTAIRSSWGAMRVKHEWNNIPDNWVALGHPPNGSTIDLYIALKPNRENALTNALYEVSQPGSPKQVLFTTPLLDADSSLRADSSFQIWCLPDEGAGC